MEEVTVLAAQALEYFTRCHREGLLAPNAAVIFDIDDTVFNTDPAALEEYNLGLLKYHNYILPKGYGLLSENYFPPIEPIVSLFEEVKRLGITVLFLTGRYEHFRKTTEENLLRLGIEGWEQLVMRNSDEAKMHAKHYKSARRAKWAEVYDIVGNVGDQLSDFWGGNNGYMLKMPNKMYFIH